MGTSPTPPDRMSSRDAAVYFGGVSRAIEDDIDSRRSIDAMQFSAQMRATEALNNAMSQGFSNMLELSKMNQSAFEKDREFALERERQDADLEMRRADRAEASAVNKINMRKAQLEVERQEREAKSWEDGAALMGPISGAMSAFDDASNAIVSGHGTSEHIKIVRDMKNLTVNVPLEIAKQGGSMADEHRQTLAAIASKADTVLKVKGRDGRDVDLSDLIQDGERVNLRTLPAFMQQIDNTPDAPEDMRKLSDNVRKLNKVSKWDVTNIAATLGRNENDPLVKDLVDANPGQRMALFKMNEDEETKASRIFAPKALHAKYITADPTTKTEMLQKWGKSLGDIDEADLRRMSKEEYAAHIENMTAYQAERDTRGGAALLTSTQLAGKDRVTQLSEIRNSSEKSGELLRGAALAPDLPADLLAPAKARKEILEQHALSFGAWGKAEDEANQLGLVGEERTSYMRGLGSSDTRIRGNAILQEMASFYGPTSEVGRQIAAIKDQPISIDAKVAKARAYVRGTAGSQDDVLPNSESKRLAQYMGGIDVTPGMDYRTATRWSMTKSVQTGSPNAIPDSVIRKSEIDVGGVVNIIWNEGWTSDEFAAAGGRPEHFLQSGRLEKMIPRKTAEEAGTRQILAWTERAVSADSEDREKWVKAITQLRSTLDRRFGGNEWLRDRIKQDPKLVSRAEAVAMANLRRDADEHRFNPGMTTSSTAPLVKDMLLWQDPKSYDDASELFRSYSGFFGDIPMPPKITTAPKPTEVLQQMPDTGKKDGIVRGL